MPRTGAQTGDLVFFGADKARVVNDALGALRIKVGQDLGLVGALVDPEDVVVVSPAPGHQVPSGGSDVDAA